MTRLELLEKDRKTSPIGLSWEIALYLLFVSSHYD